MYVCRSRALSQIINIKLCVGVLVTLSRVWLFVTPWTTAHQAFLSMGFSRPEY